MGAGATIVSSVQQKRGGGNISQSFSLFVFVVPSLLNWI